MFTVEDFIKLVEEDMPFATTHVKKINEDIQDIAVYYEDYKSSTFHNYHISVNKEIVNLEIFVDGIEKPIERLMPENLKHAYDVMKGHDDLMWLISDLIDRGDEL